MPSNGLINYPFCATQALHTFPSPEWYPVSRVWKRTGSPPNEQSLFSEAENRAEWLFVSFLVLCLLPYLLSLPKTIIKSRRVSRHNGFPHGGVWQNAFSSAIWCIWRSPKIVPQRLQDKIKLLWSRGYMRLILNLVGFMLTGLK